MDNVLEIISDVMYTCKRTTMHLIGSIKNICMKTFQVHLQKETWDESGSAERSREGVFEV